MRVPLAQQAKEILGQSDLVMLTERVDDVALRIGPMVTRGCGEVLDRHRPRHWKPRRLRWGWTAVIWLAYILTEGDHRTGTVAADIKGMPHTLSHLSGQRIAPLDGREDRVGHLLTHFSTAKYGHALAQDLHACRSAVYALLQDVLRGDATTVSGAHDVTDGGLVPCGHSQDDPTRPQSKVLMGALDPLGMP
jgi:transposase